MRNNDIPSLSETFNTENNENHRDRLGLESRENYFKRHFKYDNEDPHPKSIEDTFRENQGFVSRILGTITSSEEISYDDLGDMIDNDQYDPRDDNVEAANAKIGELLEKQKGQEAVMAVGLELASEDPRTGITGVPQDRGSYDPQEAEFYGSDD